MSKVTSFLVPDKTREKVDAIIDIISEKTGENISLARAICEAIDYYYGHKSVDDVVGLIDKFLGRAFGVGIPVLSNPAKEFRAGDIVQAISEIQDITDQAIDGGHYGLAEQGAKIIDLLKAYLSD